MLVCVSLSVSVNIVCGIVPKLKETLKNDMIGKNKMATYFNASDEEGYISRTHQILKGLQNPHEIFNIFCNNTI